MRRLWTALVFCLTFYAPFELSRLILRHELDMEYIAELVILWSFYIAAIVIVYRLTKRR